MHYTSHSASPTSTPARFRQCLSTAWYSVLITDSYDSLDSWFTFLATVRSSCCLIDRVDNPPPSIDNRPVTSTPTAAERLNCLASPQTQWPKSLTKTPALTSKFTTRP